MRRASVAFLLACLTVAALWSGFYDLTQPPSHLSNRIIIYTGDSSDPVGDQKVEAIKGLHLQNAQVMKVVVSPITFKNFVWGVLGITVLSALLTGFVVFFYKLYCRWLGVIPHL